MTDDEFQELMAERRRARRERDEIYKRSIQAPRVIIDWGDPVKVDEETGTITVWGNREIVALNPVEISDETKAAYEAWYKQLTEGGFIYGWYEDTYPWSSDFEGAEPLTLEEDES